MSESKSEIGRLVREVQDSYRKIRQAYQRKDHRFFKLLIRFMDLERKLSECMNAQAGLELEPQLAKTVRDLRDKRNFDLIDGTSIWNFIDAAVRFAEEKTESEEIVVEKEPPDVDMYEFLDKSLELEDEENSRNLRRKKVGTVIVTSRLPESVKKNLRVVKDLYAYGMFEAVTIYCRALLEASIDDAVDRQGWHSQDHRKQNVTAITNTKKGNTLSVLLSEHGRKLFGNSFTDRIRKTVQSRANSILHFKDRLYEGPPEPVSSQEAFDQIKLTHEVIEKLYSGWRQKR